MAGRPPTKPKKLRDGFYIELKNPGDRSGVKIRRDSKEEIDEALKQYAKTKDVEYLGQVLNGKFVKQKK